MGRIWRYVWEVCTGILNIVSQLIMIDQVMAEYITVLIANGSDKGRLITDGNVLI